MKILLPLVVELMHVLFQIVLLFGSNMPHQKDMCHQVDEFIGIDTLLSSTKIYAQAIYELAKKSKE